MTFNGRHKVPAVLALNALRVQTPACGIPAAMVPYGRDELHALLDRPGQDVFAQRVDDAQMVVVPLREGAGMPGPTKVLGAADNLRLVSSLAREAVFRMFVGRSNQGHRVTRRRPLVVESARFDNLIPSEFGLPEWLKKRVVLSFDTRIVHTRGSEPGVVLTCSSRLRAVIGLHCAGLAELGIPMIGAAVTTDLETRMPGVAPRRAYAGTVTGIRDDGLVCLDDVGEGAAQVAADQLYLEPTRANFEAVVRSLTQGRMDDFEARMRQVEAEWHAGGRTFDGVGRMLGWLRGQSLDLARGVPLRFGDLLDQAGGPGTRFPRTETILKPRLSFAPSGSSSATDPTPQRGLDASGPYDRDTFQAKRLRIAVVCEAHRRSVTEATVDDFLRGLPDVSTGGPSPLKPHPHGLLGRFRLDEPEVRLFESDDATAAAYVAAARKAVSVAAARDERWDLALVQVSRTWQDRPDDDSPYWAAKAAFLKHETPVQAISVEAMQLPAFQYACSLANMSLATYAKLGGYPWLLPIRVATDHEIVVGLGSHVTKTGRRGPGDRVVGIATVFSGQGHYVLDSRTAAVPFERYPEALRDTVVDAIGRVRDEQGWRPADGVRIAFHAFIEMRREAVDAVLDGVAGLGLARASFAFVHVAQDHPFLAFDQAVRTGKGAYAPERGQAVELGEAEWLLTLTGRDQVKADGQGLPHPVLLRLHKRSTWRDMPAIVRQVSDFACHSWRTFGPARLPITLGYADQIARQLAGLERTPNWDPDALEGSRIMRRPWYL